MVIEQPSFAVGGEVHPKKSKPPIRYDESQIQRLTLGHGIYELGCFESNFLAPQNIDDLQGCRFVPYTFSETIRHRWYQAGSKYWFPGFCFDSGPNLQP